MRKLHRTTALLLIMLMGLFQIQISHAAMVTTDGAIQTQQIQMERAEILGLFAQDNLRDQLTQMGIDPDKASDRIANMTNTEIAQLNEHLKDMPAGEGVGSVLLVIFIVFVITDMLGATDIFTFIRPITR